MSDLHNFNAGRKSWKMYAKELTSKVGDDLTITPYDGEDLILEVSGNGNILFKEDGITYNLADLSNAASSSSNVNLTNYDDASFGNVDISGIINFFATDEQLLGPDTGIAQKVQDLSNSVGDLSNNLANLSINNIASLTGTDGSTSYDYIHVTTSQHVKSSWSYGSDLSITTARAGMLIDGGLFIHASDPQGNGSGTKSILDSVSEQFANGGDVPLEADFMVGGTSHLIGNTYIGPNGNLILFGDIMGSSGQTILSSSGIVFESDLNVLNVGSDPKSYSSGISGEVLTSQGQSNPPIWVPLNEEESGIRIESDLNVLNVGSDPKSYSSGISGEVLTSQGGSNPPIWGSLGGGGTYSAFTNVDNNFTVGQTIGGDSTINGLTIGRGGGERDVNTAIGEDALITNTSTGSYNTAVGRSTLQYNTTGTQNTAIGAFASRNSSLGAYNTAIGSEALLNNTGNWNTAIGRHAMAGGTGGQYNVAIGPMALYLNTNSHNTAVGLEALVYTTTGGGNTAIGSRAMYNNTTGNYNTAVGWEAGYRISNGNNLNVAYESTFIGQDTRANADSETNQIVIGRGAIGNGSNTITLGNTNSTQLYLPGLQAGAATGDVLTFDGTKIALAAAGGGGGGPDVLSLKLNQTWSVGSFSYPWQAGSRLGPEFSSNPYDIIGTAPSSLSIGTDYLITANTAGIYKFEIAASYRWYAGCTFNRTLWTCIRNGYTLAGYTGSGQTGYDIVHKTWNQRHGSVAPPYDWSFPENFLFTIQMAAGDRIMHGHERNVQAAALYGAPNDSWSYTVTVTKVG